MCVVIIATSHDIEVLVGLLGYLFEQEEEFKPNHALQKKGLALILENDKIGAIAQRSFVIGMLPKVVNQYSNGRSCGYLGRYDFAS